MIAGLRGKIEFKGLDFVIINVGGISFKVFIPTSALSTLAAVGEEASLHTHLHVREDALTLYGFTTPDHVSLFETLLGVTGVGPKVGLSILSVVAPDRLMFAIASENADILIQVPGVGKKMAARLILELRGKIDPGKVTAPLPPTSHGHSQVMAALGALGYTLAEAAAAAASVPDSPDISPEEKIRLALAYFASR